MAGTRICLYELTMSGGWSAADASDLGQLAAEGQAMLRALAEDLSKSGATVTALVDVRQPEGWTLPGVEIIAVEPDGERQRLQEASAAADSTLVIAPECDGLLAERFDWVAAAGGRWLGCGRATIELAGDKHRMAEALRERGVAAPAGARWAPGSPWPETCPLPAVVKPLDGAGSQGVRRVASPPAIEELDSFHGVCRVEPLVAGQAASVAVLCGPHARIPLEPCWQEIVAGDEGALKYVGGGLPLPRDEAKRATRLALHAVASLPDPMGYVGVDLVLGSCAAGDVVIEINPRLTTSYVGLRAACRQNLAAAMLDVAQGEPADLDFDPAPLRFTANGAIARGERRELARA